MAKPRPKRGDDELREASRHLNYEMSMLEATRGRLVGGIDKTTENILVESFLIHARNLIDFLQPTTHLRDDDVIAADFFVGAAVDWEDVFKKVNIFTPAMDIEGIRDRINKRLAHLTYDRLNIPPGGDSWDTTLLTRAILDGVDLFLTQVDPDLLYVDWRKGGGKQSPPLPSGPTVPNHTGPITDPRTRYVT
jgi:hypothetical protein